MPGRNSQEDAILSGIKCSSAHIVGWRHLEGTFLEGRRVFLFLGGGHLGKEHAVFHFSGDALLPADSLWNSRGTHSLIH